MRTGGQLDASINLHTGCTYTEFHIYARSAAQMKKRRFSLLVQCAAVTRKGQRCSISEESTVKCADGTMAGAPLSNGCNRCMFHLELICLRPVSVREPVLIYLDFETSGLSVTGDFIVEVGLLEHANHAVFSSVVCPPVFGEGPNVHGIEESELKEGCVGNGCVGNPVGHHS